MMLVHPSLIPPERPVDLSDPQTQAFETEYDARNALVDLGHEVRVVGVYDDLAPVRRTIEEWRPHIAFNLLEEFAGHADFDYYVVSYLRMMGVPFTGCKPRGLVLARDKALSKKILKYHHIRVPDFVVFPRGRLRRRLPAVTYPMIVKSLIEQGSVGIARASYVENEAQLRERVALIHGRFDSDAIAERYIDGRELYVTVIGNTRLEVFPIRELTFNKLEEGMPRVATYKVKWDAKYRERWGIDYQFARTLPDGVPGRILHLCKRIYRVLDLSGYARMDLRLDAEGRIYVLEANPNAGIARSDDCAWSAEKAGVSYERFIQRLLNLGLHAGSTPGG